MGAEALYPLVGVVLTALLDYLVARSKSSENSLVQLVVTAFRDVFGKR